VFKTNPKKQILKQILERRYNISRPAICQKKKVTRFSHVLPQNEGEWQVIPGRVAVAIHPGHETHFRLISGCSRFDERALKRCILSSRRKFQWNRGDAKPHREIRGSGFRKLFKIDASLLAQLIEFPGSRECTDSAVPGQRDTPILPDASQTRLQTRPPRNKDLTTNQEVPVSDTLELLQQTWFTMIK
jgi:hypothetical protein